MAGPHLGSQWQGHEASTSSVGRRRAVGSMPLAWALATASLPILAKMVGCWVLQSYGWLITVDKGYKGLIVIKVCNNKGLLDF